MGQYSLLLMLATLIGGTVLMSQSNTTAIASNEKHADRQEELLAREIARSGYNMMLSTARDFERANPNATLEQIVKAANGGTVDGWQSGGIDGGAYEAQLVAGGPSSFYVVSVGAFNDATHSVKQGHLREQTLNVPEVSTATSTVVESATTSCAAVYLQRMIPKNNNGHGNNVDGVDSSNKGSSKDGQDSDPSVDDEIVKGNMKSRYKLMAPELVLAPDNNRDGTAASLSATLAAGERINVYLALDKDCSEKGRTDLALTASEYDAYYPAFTNPAASFDEMEEGRNALIEMHPSDSKRWRIAFEETTAFSDEKHLDIRTNGYGDLTWSKRNNGKHSYGGTGWSLRDSKGYFKLLKRSDLPDYNDHVIELTFAPAASN